MAGKAYVIWPDAKQSKALDDRGYTDLAADVWAGVRMNPAALSAGTCNPVTQLSLIIRSLSWQGTTSHSPRRVACTRISGKTLGHGRCVCVPSSCMNFSLLRVGVRHIYACRAAETIQPVWGSAGVLLIYRGVHVRLPGLPERSKLVKHQDAQPDSLHRQRGGVLNLGRHGSCRIPRACRCRACMPWVPVG